MSKMVERTQHAEGSLRNLWSGMFVAIFVRGLVRSVALVALMLLVLVNVALLVSHFKAPAIELTLDADKISSDGSSAYIVPLEASLRFPYRLKADDEPGPPSRLVVREDGHILGPAHALHQDIRDPGRGRYSHWANHVRFSASDNSDPRHNGRRYTATDREVVSPFLANTVLGVDLGSAATLLVVGLFFGIPRAAQRWSFVRKSIVAIRLTGRDIADQFRLTKFESMLIAFATVLSLLARLPSIINPVLAMDDIIFLHSPNLTQQYEELGLEEGRFTLAVVLRFLDLFGVEIARVWLLSGVILSLTLSICAVMILRLWKVDSDAVSCFIFTALFVTHPYLTEMFLWKSPMITAGLPFLLCLFAMVIARTSLTSAVMGGALFTAALGIHQLSLTLCAIVFGIGVTLELTRSREFFDLSSHVRIGGTMVAATVCYALLAKVAIALSYKPSLLGRDTIILFSNPLVVRNRAFEILRMMIFSDPLIAPGTRWCILICLVIICVIYVRAGIGERNPLLVGIALLLPVLVAFAAILAATLTVLPRAWIPWARNLCAMSVLIGGISIMALMRASGYTRKLVIALSILIIVGFVAKSNEMTTDQIRTGMRDRRKMESIVYSLEKLPNFRDVKKVAFVGTSSSSLSGLTTGSDVSDGWGQYGTTFSIFDLFFSQDNYLTQYLNETSGYEFTDGSALEQGGRCQSGPFWPAAGSIIDSGDLVTVCLSRLAKRRLGPLDVQ